MKVLSKSKYVLVKPEIRETKLASGIIIPDNATSADPKQRWGTVLSCGDYKDPDLKEGLQVYYRVAGVIESEVDNEKLHFVPYESILGYE